MIASKVDEHMCYSCFLQDLNNDRRVLVSRRDTLYHMPMLTSRNTELVVVAIAEWI